MKKNIIILLLFSIFYLQINTYAANSDGNATFIGRKLIESTNETSIQISTQTPWTTGAKFSVDIEPTIVDNRYFVIDLEVVESINNPEAVMRLGVNGNYFLGPDQVTIQGVPTSVQKMWGDWFFIPQGRTKLFITVSDYLNQVEQIETFDIFFDTGVPGRSVKMNLWGLYLTDSIESISENLIDIDSLVFDETTGSITDEKVDTLGVKSKMNNREDAWIIDGVDLFDSINDALKIHIKSIYEGGKTVDPTNDYGFISIDVENADITPSLNSGLALQVYAFSGETYFKLFIEDINGHIFGPSISGAGPTDNPTEFKFVSDGIANTLTGFYNAIYLPDQVFGSIYLPFDQMIAINNFQGKPIETGFVDEIQKIKTIHIGFDMIYGLGRNLSVGTIAFADINEGNIQNVIQTSILGDSDIDLNNDSIITSHEKGDYLNNFVLSRLTEEELPGYVPENNTKALDIAIEIVNRLNRNIYTETSWQNLESKLITAKNIQENQILYRQTDIDSAMNQLYIAYLKLDEIETSDTQVLTMIALAVGLSAITLGVFVFVKHKKKGMLK